MSYLRAYLQKKALPEQSTAAIAQLAALDYLSHTNPAIAEKIVAELKAQRSQLKMIASENYSSMAVQLAMGNWLTDKYAEGYPYHRFYAGCENVDFIEKMAADLAQKIFGAEHAYVQPHSGADANLVAFWAIIAARVQAPAVQRLKRKNLDELTVEEYEKVRQELVHQRLLGLSLGSGGHLTHGYRHNLSSKMMHSFFYDVDPETGFLNYQTIRKKAQEVRPLILLAGYSAYPRLIDFSVMREIADEVGAVLMVDMAHFAGLVAGRVMKGHFNPVPFAHIVTTTTHKTLRGPRGGMILCQEEFRPFVDKGCPLALGGPLPHVMAAKAIAFEEAVHPSFEIYAQQIVKNCQALAEALMRKEVALTTHGTDNHLLVMNVKSSFNLSGRQAESALREAGITANRNTIPFDPLGAWYTSGVRLGTAALTTRGMKESEMRKIADWIVLVLQSTQITSGGEEPQHKAHIAVDPKVLSSVKREMEALLRQFPLYPELECE